MNNKKDKKGVTGLRWKIIRHYALITLAVAVLESAVDSIFIDVIYPRLQPDNDGSTALDPIGVTYLAVSLLMYFAGGVVFYLVTKKELISESKRRVREQNLVFAAIAHDLKTPMTSVQGFAKALSEGRIPEGEREEIYDIIYRKSRSMNELTELLFEYARLGTEEYEPKLERTDISVLVRDAAAENYSLFEENGIEPEIDIPDTPVYAKADPRELRRAVSNLMINVCRHNPAGTSALIRVKESGGKCVIAVADSGSEIPADMDIFEPFVTENTARTVGKGSGLGLAVTKRTVLRMGGGIELIRGTEGYTKAFEVTLPLSDGQ